jgi:hypothetical protein
MTVRVEADGANDLDRVLLWFSQHRGQIVELDDTKRVALGVPISGARAVIVAAVLQDDDRPGPQLGGVLRAISSRSAAEPVRLVFDGRSSGRLTPAEAEALALMVLDRISELVGDDDRIAEVA